jgi:hypothetical protein
MTIVSEWDELEARSLLSAVTNGAQDTTTGILMNRSSSSFHNSNNKSSGSYARIQIIFLLTLCAIVAIFKEDIAGLIVLDKEVNIVGKIPVEELRTLALEGKKEFDNVIRKEYGQYAEQMLRSESVLTYFKTPSDAISSTKNVSPQMDRSRERLKRRMKIKIIESQLISSDTTTNFTWVIGGHSAAAGHGNLLRQAYANIIEQSLRGVFGSLGIQFYAKNYAMGGTKSAPEVALCMESVFGRDLDIISWDYGMTDGRAPALYHLWAQRAGIHPTRPILFSYGQRYADQIHKEIEDAGGAGFEMNFLHVKTIFPNSDDGSVNVTQLPPAVKNYLCNNGHVESGEPCGDAFVKFDTNHTCPKIGYQVAWHNGWKDHLLIGRLSAAFLIEMLLQAIDELSTVGGGHQDQSNGTTTTTTMDPLSTKVIQPSISSSYLAILKEQEKKDRESFVQSIPPKDIFERKTNLSESVLSHFKRSWSFCRTALLPNQARYDGVVLGQKSHQPANYLYSGRTDYEDEGYDILKGLPLEEPENNQTEPYLVYNLKNNRHICSEAEIDFKDVFYVRYKDKWMTTTIPNNAEEEYFSFFQQRDKAGSLPSPPTDSLNGIIMLCTVPFDWGKYPTDYVSIHEMVAYSRNSTTNDTTTPLPVGNGSGIVVNGIASTDAVLVHEDRCYVLKHNPEESGYFFPPNSQGKYQLQFRVPREGNLYLSSIIVL